MKPIIELVSTLDDELFEAVINLLPQLTKIARLPTKEYIENILTSDNSILLVARISENETKPIVGMLILIIIKIPSGMYAQIEDVVVDSKYRGKGIAINLMERAISLAHEKHAKQIHLTSNPSRIEANKLYLKLGFSRRDTNVYYRDL